MLVNVFNIIYILFLHIILRLPYINRKTNDKLLQEAIDKAGRLAREKKPLLIKMNSYPSGGKSTFIKKYNSVYRGCQLLDFDKYKGDQRTIALFDGTSKTHKILFGSNNDYDENADVIFISVFPSFYNSCRNIYYRQFEDTVWVDPVKILKERLEMFNTVQNQQHIASTFKSPIDVVIDAYNQA